MPTKKPDHIRSVSPSHRQGLGDHPQAPTVPDDVRARAGAPDGEPVEPVERDLIAYPEAADLLGVQVSTLYSLVHAKRIPHVRIGPRFVRFSRRALSAWIGSHTVAPHSAQGGAP